MDIEVDEMSPREHVDQDIFLIEAILKNLKSQLGNGHDLVWTLQLEQQADCLDIMAHSMRSWIQNERKIPNE